uniref:NADH dehydrogenase subunit 6 n=1 Tax=Bryozoa sp. TaxID=2813608 RepID=A0AAU8L450_9BILA
MWDMLFTSGHMFICGLIFMMVFFIISAGVLFKLMMLLIFTISIVFLMAMNFSSWWSLMLFLIYISGMLILFSYFTAFSSKESMNFNFKLTLLMTILLSFNIDMMSEQKYLFMEWILTNIYIYIMLGLILFFILFMSCMMCFSLNNPLRSFLI